MKRAGVTLYETASPRASPARASRPRLKAYSAAGALVPDNAEMAYWHAVALVNMNRVDEALPIFAKAFRLHPRWRELTPRLPGAGLLPDDPKLIARIVGVK